MKKTGLLSLVLSLAAFALLGFQISQATEISLPKPTHKGPLSVEEALQVRRTQRSFKSRTLTLEQLSQILWAAYGVTAKVPGYYLKTAPSAGALYPLDIYALVGKRGVKDLGPGVFHFLPENHSVGRIREGDFRTDIARLSAHQMWIAKAPLILIITGEYARSKVKYGLRGVPYTHIEAGCVGQNVFLQAEALGLKAGIVGAFNTEKIISALGLPGGHTPLLIMPVGYPD